MFLDGYTNQQLLYVSFNIYGGISLAQSSHNLLWECLVICFSKPDSQPNDILALEFFEFIKQMYTK